MNTDQTAVWVLAEEYYWARRWLGGPEEGERAQSCKCVKWSDALHVLEQGDAEAGGFKLQSAIEMRDQLASSSDHH